MPVITAIATITVHAKRKGDIEEEAEEMGEVTKKKKRKKKKKKKK